jgi:hypothetical protein
MIMMAVSSIHVVVRAMDDLSILMFRNTWALQVVPFKHFGFVESCPAHDACKGVEAFYEVDAERGFIITSVRKLTRLRTPAYAACSPLRAHTHSHPPLNRRDTSSLRCWPSRSA